MNFELLILRVPAILIALTIHEFAHGWMALRLGDTTARNEGRLTLNPVAHLDLFGTIMLLFGPFGWAKPVPVNGYNFKKPKRDILLVSLAGPLSNVIMALIIGYTIRILGTFWPSLLLNGHTRDFLYLCFLLNIGISFFNLIPVPPLDGSKILLGLLPDSWIPGYIQKSRYLPMIFMVLLIAEWGLHMPIFSSIMNPIFNPYLKFFNFLIFGKVF
ncbi:MAG: site-2 protease family protein [Fibrobacter sp.]|jgi:Zn-dependent protease|nr:site-2 protease family protein [Fibrobacter sp.]